MTENNCRILVINPGSTSTKIAVFEGATLRCDKTLRHDESEIGRFASIPDQKDFRMQAIMEFLSGAGIPLSSLSAIVGRGGLLHPIEGGTYAVNEAMLRDLKTGLMGQHASNLGGLLAHELSAQCGAPAFIVDPVVVDELEPVARFSGLPELPRVSIFHALNHKAVARAAAKDLGGTYADFNFIVAHMGGGISVAAHCRGRVIDVNNALNGEGPFSPERSGTLPVGALVKLCFSGTISQKDLEKRIVGKGGVMAYLGTNDMRKVSERIACGDAEAKAVYEAMAYQVAKEIGAMDVVLEGKVDAILLTGGLAYDQNFVGWIERRVRHLAPVRVYPGEEEMTALVGGGLRVLRGEEQPRIYE
jgi:butyrate kinase